jgi:two-component system, NtrC family, sensor kinase
MALQAVGWSFVLASHPATASAAPSAVLERALGRERAAREQAESLLEKKSRELHLASEALQAEHKRVQQRNTELEQAHAALQAAQAQLIRSEKLASVGQLAAGVAHEINNPIGFITSNLGTLGKYTDVLGTLLRGYRRYADGVCQGSTPAGLLAELAALEEQEDIDFILDDIGDLLQDSIEGSRRVKEIVQGLKSFSRIDDAQLSAQDLHAGIQSTLKVVANEIKYNCEVVTDFGELPPVHCNLAQLNQVFMNLIVNASQAMESSGTITITTRREGDDAVLRFADTGAGIPADKLGSVFDPFFTTKPVGSGTGLGLSISFGIVRDHGGTIEVESEVGKGTEFIIRLPLNASTA